MKRREFLCSFLRKQYDNFFLIFLCNTVTNKIFQFFIPFFFFLFFYNASATVIKTNINLNSDNNILSKFTRMQYRDNKTYT